MNKEISEWKLGVGNVFRSPAQSQILCIMVDDEMQILGMAVVTILFTVEALNEVKPTEHFRRELGNPIMAQWLDKSLQVE